MTSSLIALGNAVKLTGKSEKVLRKMVADGQLNATRTPQGHLRFTAQSLKEINPALSFDKSELSLGITGRYVRPKRLITTNHLKGELMESYVRDSSAVIAFCRGFEKEGVSLALMMMVDLMAQHSDSTGGIPCQPLGYLPGLLGMTQRKWTQTIEPALVQAKKIRTVTKNGIKVWVFADEYMSGPRALFKPVPTAKWEHKFPDAMMDGAPASPTMQELRAKGRERLQATHERMNREARPHGATEVEREALGLPDVPFRTSPMVPEGTMVALDSSMEEVARVTGINTDPKPYWETSQDKPEQLQPVPQKVEDTTPVQPVPSHSAYEVLKQAGIDVDGHPRGEFFWLRSDHHEQLNKWLETVPLNEIVARLDKARVTGRLPDVANTLVAYDSIVMGEK
jgi:hypothetical protein